MSRPFDEARYRGLLEGLEVSEVSRLKVSTGAETSRFDPEYFQKQHLADERLVIEYASRFSNFTDLGLRVDASAFYPSIEGYYDQGILPFLRVADVDSMIDFQACTRIPAELCSWFPTLSRVHPGDIVLTKGGSVARIGLVTEEAAVSRDLIFLNSSQLPEADRVLLYLYFQSGFFNRALIRSSSQTAQPHLTITLVRQLPIFIAGNELKQACLRLVQMSFHARSESLRLAGEAEQTLLRALGLENWQPPEPLTYTRSSQDAFTAGRLDSEHFKPKYEGLETHIRATGSFTKLEALLTINERGTQPDYAESGLAVVNSKHVANGEVRLNEDNRVAITGGNALKIKLGDVLMNGTGVGTIGRAAPFLHDAEALPDNHVTVLRPKAGYIDPVYLSVYLNSLAGQYQVNKWLRGSSGQIELYPNDIAQFLVWIAPAEVQQAIRKAIDDAFAAKRNATRLLDAAKCAVEIAIESGEANALGFLNREITSQ